MSYLGVKLKSPTLGSRLRILSQTKPFTRCHATVQTRRPDAQWHHFLQQNKQERQFLRAGMKRMQRSAFRQNWHGGFP